MLCSIDERLGHYAKHVFAGERYEVTVQRGAFDGKLSDIRRSIYAEVYDRNSRFSISTLPRNFTHFYQFQFVLCREFAHVRKI